jgi:hypothetical protein
LRRWLRHDETFSATEEEMVYIYEPKVGRNLSDEEERSTKDLINFQVGKGSNVDLQEDNEMRFVKYLIDFNEGRSETLGFQVGKEDEMRLFESLKSS